MACMNLMALGFLYICRFYSDRETSVTLVSVKKNHLRDGMGCYFNQDKNKIRVKLYESCGFKIENEICFKRQK